MSELQHISEYVYWLPSTDPFDPALCLVVGADQSLMLDAGASAAHTRRFLDALAAQQLPSPNFIALTHWHFDHFLGASLVGAPVIAHAGTAEKIAALAHYDRSDPAHEQRAASGDRIASTIGYMREELDNPQGARIVQPSLIVHDRLDVRLGGVTCRIQHVGGDHADDSCVMYIEPDGVLFMGDCLYAGFFPVSYHTVRHTFPLLDALLAFNAQQFVQGHEKQVNTRAEIAEIAAIIRRIVPLVQQHGADEAAVLAAYEAEYGELPEDAAYFAPLFIAGRGFE
jgi:glyoxylase-like metal-dependent hydrolase (beta-lactamase superfamily II)